ncbi:MAG: hypothetical protein ACR2JO_09935 [Mycobacteriales bacterium]
MTAHDRGEPVDCVQLGAGLWLAWVIYQDRPGLAVADGHDRGGRGVHRVPLSVLLPA